VNINTHGHKLMNHVLFKIDSIISYSYFAYQQFAENSIQKTCSKFRTTIVVI
jgi:hypothetical protein